jgi:hypothetical protein
MGKSKYFVKFYDLLKDENYIYIIKNIVKKIEKDILKNL